MINKENILFCLVGLFAGLFIGFVLANSVNRSAGVTAGIPSGMPASGMLPSGHPPTGGDGSSIPEVTAAIEAARNQPDNYEAQIKAAELYYQIQRFDGAIEFLKRATELKPDDYTTVVNLGNAYFDAAKYEEAEKTYTAALEKKPEDVDVRTDLGLTFAFRPQPNYDRAIQEFNKVLEKAPNHILALQNLVVAFTKKGDAAKANEALARLESVDPGNVALQKLREDISGIPAN